jgi:hypothetical protein
VSEQAAQPVSFRLGLYEAIRRTAAAQRDAVQCDDLDGFYGLLEERERLLEKTEAVQQELEPAERARAVGIVREIMLLDQETEQLLTGRIEATRDELSGVARGRQAMAGYAYAQQPTRDAAWGG